MNVATKAPARPRRRLVATSALVVLVALLGAYLLWWSKPTAFGGWGDGVAASLEVGATTSVNMSGPLTGEVVTLRAVKPVVVENTADADIEYVMCRMKGEIQLGAGTEPLGTYCSAVLTVDGRQMRGSSEREYLLARVTPRKAGVVKLDGMKVSYTRHGWKHLWQTGTEQAGTGVRLTAR